jgi:hypothetical protein
VPEEARPNGGVSTGQLGDLTGSETVGILRQ